VIIHAREDFVCGTLDADREKLAAAAFSGPLLRTTGMKFHTALAAFAGIAVLAWLTLDGKMLAVVLIFLAGLAVKSYLVTLRKP